jgi:transcriptional regulator with XRE-family HTH domain
MAIDKWALRNLRRVSEFTAEQIADKLGCKRSALYDLESGKTGNGYIDKLSKLAAVYDLEVELKLIGRSPSGSRRVYYLVDTERA